MKFKLLKGYVFVIISAVIFGCMPLMAKHIYADGVNSISLVFMRNLFSLPVLAALSLWENRSLKIAPKNLPRVGIVSIFGYVLTPYLLFTSYDYMDSGAATVLHFVYPVAVILIELIFFRKGLSLGGIIGLSLFTVGLPLFYTPGVQIGLIGSIIAIVSGITYAIYIVLIGKLKPENGGFTFSFYLAIFATVTLFIIALATGKLSLPKSPLAWILSVTFGILVNGGAMMLFQRGTFIIGSSKAALISAMEPVTSLLVGAMFLSEHVGILAIVGSALLIGSSVAIAVLDKKKKSGCPDPTAEDHPMPQHTEENPEATPDNKAENARLC